MQNSTNADKTRRRPLSDTHASWVASLQPTLYVDELKEMMLNVSRLYIGHAGKLDICIGVTAAATQLP